MQSQHWYGPSNYVIKLVSEAYKLQEDKTRNRKTSTADELVVKIQYMDGMQNNMNRYWEK